MQDEEDTGPSNYVPVLLKYKWMALAAALFLLVLTVLIVVLLPPVYRSAGKVLVETQQIPTDLVRSTVTSAASERIEVIRQRVMTRDRLLSVMEKYTFFELEDNSPMEISRKLDDVREAINIEVIDGVTRNQRGPVNTIAFSVSFDSTNPFVAQAVANDLVTLFLSENSKVRTERASETTDFLESEANKVKEELDETEEAVAEFKQKNKDALPEHLDLYVDIREESSRRLNDINRDMRSLQEQISFIRSQAQLGNESIGDTPISSTEGKIIQLQQELSSLLLIYEPAHPDVVEIRSQIALLKASPDTQLGTDAGVYKDSQAFSISQQLSDLKSKLISLSREKRSTEAKIADMEARILRVPQVERALTTLTRENESKINQYNLLVAKSMEASVAESLEEDLKAERFSLLEPPIRPVKPFKPDRKKLLLLAIFFSVGLPVAVLLALGFFNRNIIGASALSRFTDIPLIGEIPHYQNLELKLRQRETLKKAAIYTAGGLLVFLVILHFAYMPINEILSKAIFRFG